jgi:hypothetical protein
LILRNTGLDDKGHVEFSRMFGELDDITPYSKLGRVNRLAYDERVSPILKTADRAEVQTLRRQ